MKTVFLSLLLCVCLSTFGCNITRHIGEKWISGGGLNSTHAWIVGEAVRLLEQTEESKSKFFPIIKNNMDTIKLYANSPDVVQNDHLSFRGHFYNPYTERNYLGMMRPTAMTRFLEHATKALLYEPSEPEFLKHIGMGAHFLEDACQPYHAHNKVAGLTWHSPFEWFAMDVQDKYAYDGDIDPIILKGGYKEFLEYLLYECSMKAHDLYPKASASSYKSILRFPFKTKTRCYVGRFTLSTPNCDEWEEAAAETLKNSQIAVLRYLQRVLIEVEEIDNLWE